MHAKRAKIRGEKRPQEQDESIMPYKNEMDKRAYQAAYMRRYRAGQRHIHLHMKTRAQPPERVTAPASRPEPLQPPRPVGPSALVPPALRMPPLPAPHRNLTPPAVPVSRPTRSALSLPAVPLYQPAEGIQPSGLVEDPDTGETIWTGQPPRRRWWHEVLRARRQQDVRLAAASRGRMMLDYPAGIAPGYGGAMPPALHFSNINQRYPS